MSNKEKVIFAKWLSMPVPFSVTLSTGEKCVVYFHGVENRFDGPDLMGCVLKLSNGWLVGDVEIHSKASDWIKHGHHLDPAYEGVLFHLVELDDKVCYTKSGRVVPAVEIGLLNTFNSISIVLDSVQIADVLKGCFFSRIEQRKNFFRYLLKKHDLHIYDALWHHILIGIGKPVFTDVFEWLGYRIPWSQVRDLNHPSSFSFLLRTMISQSPFPLKRRTLPGGLLEKKLVYFEELFNLKKTYLPQEIKKNQWRFFTTKGVALLKETILRYYINALFPVLCVLFPDEEIKFIRNLETLPPEKNSVINTFAVMFDYFPKNLMEAQGILEFMKQSSAFKYQQTIKIIQHG